MTIITKTPRAPRAPRKQLPSMVAFTLLDKKGAPYQYERAVTPVTFELLAESAKVTNTLEQGIVDALLLGTALPFPNGSELIKAMKAKGDKLATSKNRRAPYLALNSASKIREVTTEALSAKWNAFVSDKIKERATIQKENIALKAKGETEKTLPRITEPSLKGLMDLIIETEPTPDFDKIVKYVTSAQNLIAEQKGKNWIKAHDMTSALLTFIDSLK
jgi:hypothetical protein